MRVIQFATAAILAIAVGCSAQAPRAETVKGETTVKAEMPQKAQKSKEAKKAEKAMKVEKVKKAKKAAESVHIDEKARKKLGLTEEQAIKIVNTLILDTDADPDEGPAPLKVHFSVEPDEKISSPKYHWDFDDGTTSSQKSPTHVYKKPGTYMARVRVQDGAGVKTGKDTVRVDVDQPGD